MSDQPYNLDDGVSETFHFTVKGHEYIFRQMNTEEVETFQGMKGDKEIREFLYKFITKVRDDSPEFSEMAKQLTTPHWGNFMRMVVTEMTGKNGNS